MYHAACIWGVESYPSSKEGMKGVLPTGSFVTCSSDDTIRVWNLDPNMGTNTIYRRNIYSNVRKTQKSQKKRNRKIKMLFPSLTTNVVLLTCLLATYLV